MDTWIVFTSLWLRVSCCEHSWLSINICTDMSSFLFNAHLGVEFLGHIVTLCLTYWGTEGYFPNHCTILNSHQKSERSTFSTSLPTLITIIFQIMAILVSVKWDSTVLICVFQMTNDFEAHFMFSGLSWRSYEKYGLSLLLLLRRFSRVQLCATP